MSKKAQHIYGFDTQTMIWGVRDAASGQRPEMPPRCRTFVNHLHRQKTEMRVSAITIAELMKPLSPEERGPFLARCQRFFGIAPFNEAAAFVASALESMRRQLVQPNTGQRAIFTADHLIVASVRVAGVTHWVSDDDKCRKLAEAAGMTAMEVPLGGLFEE